MSDGRRTTTLAELDTALDEPQRAPLERKRANRTRAERGRHQRRVRRAPDPRPAIAEATGPASCCYCDEPPLAARYVCTRHAEQIEQRAAQLRGEGRRK